MNKNRDQLKAQYKNLYSELQSILFTHDLMGINFETNTDEYDPEVDTILPRLKTAESSEDVAKIIFEEFEKWFDKEEAAKIAEKAYLKLANDVWVTWNKFNAKET
jgi:hypothetical protein